MIPYKIKFFLDTKNKDVLAFESNEKPIKGDLYKIQDSRDQISEVKITEVVKIVIRGKTDDGVLEYHCQTEKHEASAQTIGFGKR